MSDIEWLFIAVGVLYLADSGVWLGATTRVFSSWWGGRFSPAYAEGNWANDRGGFHFAFPSPTAVLLFSEHWPIAVSPAGVLGFGLEAPGARSRPPASEIHVSFTDSPTFTVDGKRLLANGRVLAQTHQPQLASLLTTLLNELAAAPIEEREAILDRRLDAAFDHPSASQRWTDARKSANAIQYPTTAVFFMSFVVGPVLYFGYRLEPWILSAAFYFLLAYFYFWWWSAVEFYLLHRKLFPTRKSDRIRYTFEAFLIPAAAMRGKFRALLPLFGGWHPLAGLASLAPPTYLLAGLRQSLHDLKHPLMPYGEDWPQSAHEIDAYFRQKLIEQAERLAASLGIERVELWSAPMRFDPSAEAWCPRCEREFAAAEFCENCGGLRLERFPATEPAS